MQQFCNPKQWENGKRWHARSKGQCAPTTLPLPQASVTSVLYLRTLATSLRSNPDGNPNHFFKTRISPQTSWLSILIVYPFKRRNVLIVSASIPEQVISNINVVWNVRSVIFAYATCSQITSDTASRYKSPYHWEPSCWNRTTTFLNPSFCISDLQWRI